jgi:fructokinase
MTGTARIATDRPPVLVGLGELLWDLLPAGRQLGGAPANFAFHAGALGADARVVSRVGDDVLGREARDRLASLGLSTAAIEVDPVRPTGTVGVVLAVDGQPQFTIHEGVAWDALEDTPEARRAVDSADGLCFGTLAQRSPASRAALQRLVAAAPANALRVLDVNLRQHFHSRTILEESLGLANVVKVNDDELARIAEVLGLVGDERTRIAGLAERHGLRCVACTRGARGSLLFSGGEWSEEPGIATRVADTIGAGDAFTAALTLGLLAGWPLATVNARAGQIAAFVCSQPGATPSLPAALCAPFRGFWRASRGAAQHGTQSAS